MAYLALHILSRNSSVSVDAVSVSDAELVPDGARDINPTLYPFVGLNSKNANRYLIFAPFAPICKYTGSPAS